MRTCRRTAALALSLVVGAGLLAVGSGSALSPAGAAPSHAAGKASLKCKRGTGTGAPGVTRTTIKVAAISTLSGILAADFGSLVPGVKAYFDMVNAKGGINGRTLNLAYNLDDGGNPTQFNQLAHTLVNQDHAFAAVGVATATL